MLWGRAVPPGREPPEPESPSQPQFKNGVPQTGQEQEQAVSAHESFEELLNCVRDQEDWARQEDHIDNLINVNLPNSSQENS